MVKISLCVPSTLSDNQFHNYYVIDKYVISTATIILVKYYPLESYGQNISLCTIHSVRQSGIAPVFVTCIILGLHFKVSKKERIRL